MPCPNGLLHFSLHCITVPMFLSSCCACHPRMDFAFPPSELYIGEEQSTGQPEVSWSIESQELMLSLPHNLVPVLQYTVSSTPHFPQAFVTVGIHIFFAWMISDSKMKSISATHLHPVALSLASFLEWIW